LKAIFTLILLLPLFAHAADDTYTIQIKDHHFVPEKLTIPAGKKVILLIENMDATPEEFESHALNREKVIAGNSKATVYIGPLSAGNYTYYGEFNEATAQGVIVAK
jgi:hypothetical protein